MDKTIQKLKNKVKTLKFRTGKTNHVTDKWNKETQERQHPSVATISTMVNTLKENIEEGMFFNGDSEERVKVWVEETKATLAEADQWVRHITKQLKAQESLTLQKQQKKLEFERLLTEQKLKQEQEAAERAYQHKLDYEKEKIKLDFEYQQELKNVQERSVSWPTVQAPGGAKMPSL